MLTKIRSFFSFWNIFFILIVVSVLGLLGVVLTSHSKPSKIPIVLTTPTPIQYQWKEYGDTTRHYVLPVPPSWSITSADPTGRDTEFSFTDSGKQYTFSIAVGNVIPDASLTQIDSRQQQTVTYGGKSFLKILWIRNNSPFFVIAIPNDPAFHFYAFTMDIPASDPQRYIGMFDQIMNKMVVEKTLDDIAISPEPVSQ